MFIVTLILSVLLAVGFVMAGVSKIRRAEPVTGTLVALGVGPQFQTVIGALEVAGAIGIVAGLWLQPLGVIAAVGLALLMLSAVVWHIRAKDSIRDSMGAIVLFAVSVIVLVLQLLFA